MSSVRSVLFRSDISVRWNREGTEAPFALCELDRPSYQMMSPQESDYYFYWRSMVRKGKFLRSCDGYLYLFTCEIINTDEGAEENLRNLLSVSKVYRKSNPELLDRMQDACFTYAKIHKLPEPEITRAMEPALISYQITKRLEQEEVGMMPIGLIRNLMSESDLKYIDDKHPYDELFTRCIRKINALEINYHGKPLSSRLQKKRRCQYPVYEGFRYFGDRERASVEMSDVVRDINMRSFLRSTLKCLIREVRIREGLSAPLPNSFPPAYREMVVRTVTDWANGDWTPEDMHGPRIVISRHHVRSALADLEAVSEMMAVGDEPDGEPTEPAPAEKMQCDSPWETFSGSLDDGQRQYLRACLEGNGRAKAKELGVRMTAVEESINDISMDTVGDTVVEDGNIFEEYEENIKEAV